MAGSASFSNDGAHVFILSEKGLLDVDLSSNKTREIPLDLKGETRGISSAPEALLVATEDALYRVAIGSHATTELCKVPDNTVFDDVAYDPASKGILLCCSPKDYDKVAPGAENWRVMYLKPGTAAPVEVWMRRVRFIEAPVFDRNGNLFFATEGDIWRGRLDFSGERPSLSAFRFAPIATRETQNGTPSQIGARELALAGKRIYACVRRMGGSGWGKIVSLPKPDLAGVRMNKDLETINSSPEEFEGYWAIYKAVLSSLRVHGDLSGIGYVCGTANEDRVFFRTQREGPKGDISDFWLANKDAEPKRINIQLPGQH